MEEAAGGIPVIQGVIDDNFKVSSIVSIGGTTSKNTPQPLASTGESNCHNSKTENVNTIEVSLDSNLQAEQLEQGSIIQSIDEMGNVVFYVVLDQETENSNEIAVKVDEVIKEETGQEEMDPNTGAALFVMPQDADAPAVKVEEHRIVDNSDIGVTHFPSISQISSSPEIMSIVKVERSPPDLEDVPPSDEVGEPQEEWEEEGKNQLTLILEQTQSRVNLKAGRPNTSGQEQSGPSMPNQSLRHSSRPRKPKTIWEPGESQPALTTSSNEGTEEDAQSMAEGHSDEETGEVLEMVEEEAMQESTEGRETETSKKRRKRKMMHFTCNYCNKILSTQSGEIFIHVYS
jgi:hypothetical protein